MSYCSQNFYGKTSNVTIKNINNVLYQGNTQEATRRNTHQTNQGKCDCIFRKKVKLIIKFSEKHAKTFLRLTNLIGLILDGIIFY